VFSLLSILFRGQSGKRNPKQQMFVIMSGMLITFFLILRFLPNEMTLAMLCILLANDKMNIVNFSIDPEEKITWSGITGGFFLALAYFGTDQSQVVIYPASLFVKVRWD
jgi:hypothetical protein